MDFLEVEEYRLHTCPGSRVSDHRAWTGKSRQLSRGFLTKCPAGALRAKGT